MSTIWNGDVDMADGKLEEAYAAYKKRLNFVDRIGLPPRNSRHEIGNDLQLIKASISSDLDIISDGKHRPMIIGSCLYIILHTL